MSRPDEAGLMETEPMGGKKAGTGVDMKPRATPTEIDRKVPCRWEAPIPEWLWAWAGLVRVRRDRDENTGSKQNRRQVQQDGAAIQKRDNPGRVCL
jgi:hypothetical protein